MTKQKYKFIILAIVFMLGLLIMQTSIYASNTNIQILEKGTGDYIIYIKDNLDKNFEFAFSNDRTADKETLTYYTAETDSTEVDANKIAYINSETIDLFDNTTYIWARSGTDYILEGVEIDLSNSINEDNLQYASNLTKIIKVDTTQTNIMEETIDGKKVTTTVGKVVLAQEGNYSYILINPSETENYSQLTKLASRISKFNSETDMYTQIQVYSEFFNIFKIVAPNEDSEWVEVKENEILQPEDSEDGEKYILWIKETSTNQDSILDIQFLTSHKEYSEEKIIEKITTKLPVTYDNNTLLIVLAILIVTIIMVCIRIKMLNKKEK